MAKEKKTLRPILAEDLYGYRFLGDLNWDGKGKKAAFKVAVSDVEDNSYKEDLWLWDGKEVRPLTFTGKVGPYCWEKEGTGLVFAKAPTDKDKARQKEGKSFASFYELALAGKEAKPLFTLPITATGLEQLDDGSFLFTGLVDLYHPDYHERSGQERARIDEERKDDKDYEVLTESPFWINNVGIVDHKRVGLYHYDPQTRRLSLLSKPSIGVSGYQIDKDRVFFWGEDQGLVMKWKTGLYVVDLKSGKQRPVLEDQARFVIYGFRKVGDGFVMAAADNSHYGMNENPKFYKVDVKDGTYELIAQPDQGLGGLVATDVALGGARSDKGDGDYLYYTTVKGHDGILCRIGLDGKVEEVVRKAGAVVDFDVKDGKVIMSGLYGNKLEELYVVRKGGKLKQVSAINEKALEGKYVAKPKALDIKSEGQDVEGWYLLPQGYSKAQRYPAILDVHGGPKAAYGTVFFHEMQVWASAGYVVMFCNPYGGDGKGDAFSDMRGKYGTTDFKNLMDFTHAVLQKVPSIDPKKVCVTGGSYGGFMTNWIVTHTHFFAAAATQRSISDWITMYGVSDIGPGFADDQTGGDMFTTAGVKKLWDFSPLKYVSFVRTPILIIHSDCDYRCPIPGGYEFFTALVNEGVEARMVVFHGENHELSRSGKPLHRIRRLKEIESWFDKHVK